MEPHNQFFKILLLLGLCTICWSAFYDYSWREYTGEIPHDAVEGGWDQNNDRTYIGNVYVEDYGVVPVNIYPGKPYVIANVHGLHNISTYVQILTSSNRSKFHWIPVAKDNFEDQTAYSYLVKGGVESDQRIMHIGRISHGGQVIVAKVFHDYTGWPMYYPFEDSELLAYNYEVLVVDESEEP